MIVVVDASVLVFALAHLNDEGDDVRAWLVELTDGQPIRIIQNFTQLEVTNALRKLVLRGEIDAHRSLDAVKRFTELPAVRHIVTQPMAVRIWELRDNLTAYDAAYVALAETVHSRERQQTVLATADQKLVDSSGPTCTFKLYPSR